MRKTIIYVIGILGLGIVIFNNVVQTSEIIKENQDYFTGLLIALVVSLGYGILNIKK